MNNLGQPVCTNCGYNLTGAVASATCPECGRPLVEVMDRKGSDRPGYRRYRSTTTFLGWPLIDVAYGPDPGEAYGKARGVIALGDQAVGLIALGNVAFGGVAVGGVAVGGIAIGGVAIGGVAANGGLAIAGLAAVGGAAISGLLAVGGFAAGHWPVGGTTWVIW